MNQSIAKFLFSIVFIIPALSQGQTRYLDDVATEVEMKTHTYFQKTNEELKADVYYPKDEKTKDRPLLIYVHGGGFSGGARDLRNHDKFCRTMAKKGYVTATISYTLVMKGKSFSCDRPAPEKVQTFLLTARDISRATKYFIEKKDELGIDPSKIILLGSSAGAEAVMHAAYWKDTFKDEQGDILPSDFRYGGVVSMAGAITTLDWITKERAIPTQLFHGTCDNLVPYGYAPHHYCTPENLGYLMLHGAHSIANHLQSLGESYYLVTGCFGRHEWNVTPIIDHVDKIADFAYQSLFTTSKRQLHEIVVSDGGKSCEDYHSFDFCKE